MEGPPNPKPGALLVNTWVTLTSWLPPHLIANGQTSKSGIWCSVWSTSLTLTQRYTGLFIRCRTMHSWIKLVLEIPFFKGPFHLNYNVFFMFCFAYACDPCEDKNGWLRKWMDGCFADSFCFIFTGIEISRSLFIVQSYEINAVNTEFDSRTHEHHVWHHTYFGN